MAEVSEGRWLLLIHQLPPKPDYFRVKIRRRLHRIGAVAIKNTVYVLPHTEQSLEDFLWVVQEIRSGGGGASLCDASFVDGLNDDQVEALFQAARNADYDQVVTEARRLMETLPPQGPLDDDQRQRAEIEVSRLKRRLDDMAAIDFFGAPRREAAEGLLTGLEVRLREVTATTPTPDTSELPLGAYCGRTWVTRKGVYVDRIASAWLIRRFVDPEAQFKFVAAKAYRPRQDELRFDMFEAEFTHEGDRCTFEVLLDRFALHNQALRHIAEIVHDVDLKDAKFGRVEAPGLSRLLAGMVLAHRDDDTRLSRGCAMFDDLLAFFTRQRR